MTYFGPNSRCTYTAKQQNLNDNQNWRAGFGRCPKYKMKIKNTKYSYCIFMTFR